MFQKSCFILSGVGHALDGEPTVLLGDPEDDDPAVGVRHRTVGLPEAPRQAALGRLELPVLLLAEAESGQDGAGVHQPSSSPKRLGSEEAFPLRLPGRAGGFALLLVVEALGDLLGVPLVVELQEAGEDFPAGRLADREAGALLGLVEAVAEVEVGPAVGGGDGLVHLDVEVTELLDVGGGFVGVVEAVVGLGQALPASKHDLAGDDRSTTPDVCKAC